jgi:hypothetical protein
MSQIGVTSTGSQRQARTNLELGADIAPQIYHGYMLARKTKVITTEATENTEAKPKSLKNQRGRFMVLSHF